MLLLFLIGWLLVLSLQLVSIFFVFSRAAFHRTPVKTVARNVLVDADGHDLPNEDVVADFTTFDVTTGTPERPGVTIVVCARNELPNLRALLPLLAAQNYPNFEVLVIDDRSTDGTDRFLTDATAQFAHVRFIRIDKLYDHITPKKYALTIALKRATRPVVLLTDADCRPASADWLAGMVAQLDAHKDIVLGVSPYERRPGLLNFLIRAETLFTAVQYVSLALAGWPYMGVGRNLLYRRRVFFDNRGFYTHLRVLGGDDDLLMNEVATGRNTAVCLHPTTFTWSVPKESWADWRQQKRRHLHVSKHYKPGHKLRLGLLSGSHVLTWLLGLGVAAQLGVITLLTGNWPPADPAQFGHHPATTLLWTALGLFFLRLLTFWGIVGRISHRLGRQVHPLAIPLMDLTMAIYYVYMAVVTFVNRRKTYVWR